MIWTDVITTGLATGMAGGLVVPAGRRFLLGDIEQDWLQDELELDGIDPVDGVTVRGKDGSLSRVWHLQGTSYDARIESEQQSLLLGRQSLLQELGKRSVTVRLFAVKRQREIEDPALTLAAIERIAISLANQRGLKFNPDDNPKLSCILPGNHRCEILVGASVRSHLSLAIRCKHPFTPSWEQAGVTPAIRDYLIDKVDTDANMIISGATNTGKTTLLNMLLATVDPARRVLAIEDTPELHIEQFWDGNGLIAAREAGTGSGMVGWREIYDHLMRITPDHILFGEISTQNAFAALAALNSGVTGFMCTIHAESPWQAIHRKFDQNIAWAGETMPRVPEFLAELVDVVVQIKRNADGWRRITDIWEPRNDRYVLKDGKEVV